MRLFSGLADYEGKARSDIDADGILDWGVFKENRFRPNGDQIPNEVSIIRDKGDVFLGTTSPEYCIIQNKDTLDFCDLFVGQGEAGYKHIISLNRGEQVHIILKAPTFADLGGGDIIDSYFDIVTSHDGSQKFRAIPIVFRRYNGSIMPAPSGKGISIKHTKNATSNLLLARLVIGKVKAYFAEVPDNFEKFAKMKLDANATMEYFKVLYGGDNQRAENIRDRMMAICKGGKSASTFVNCQGTLLGAYFAAVEYAEFNMVIKSSKHMDDLSTKIHSRLVGSAAKLKTEAYWTALKLARDFA